MLFNSLEFVLFFPTVVLAYFLVPGRWRTPLLLVSSCAFYMAFIPAYILILAVTILIDYVAGLHLNRLQGRSRRLLLWASIVATCLVLFIFKYFAFVTSNATTVAAFFGWQLARPTLSIILPIGLSFHTFQSLSYVIEVYYRRQEPERNFLTYATYVMFWPQLVAGPIERPQNLLHQFYEEHRFEYARVVGGLKRMAWGFFQKLVVADRLAIYVNDVYAAPQRHNGLQLTLGTFFFAYQIYCDFAGYCDIALGSARVLGFRLMENFRTPYYSRSVQEFWQRWHISLSTWFRDYVYIPLGGSRVGPVRWAGNVLATFSLSGLWHGASWTYVLWGALNGVYLIGSRIRGGLRARWLAAGGPVLPALVRAPAALVGTFALTCLAWILFRAPTFADAGYILTHLGTGWNPHALATEHFLLRQMPLAFGGILVLEVVQVLRQRGWLGPWLTGLPGPIRWTGYLAFVLVVVLCGTYRNAAFIYFQF